MQSASHIVEQACQLVERINALPQTPASLQAIADSLRHFASSPVWQVAPYRAAAAREELLYELAVAEDRPSLYLVSDGTGVTSPPHSHATWAVVAGIRGLELNRLYTRSSGSRTVVKANEVAIGPGQAFVLNADDIHSTQVAGPSATYHLHLYGRSLSGLPSFRSRCYTLAEP